MITRTLRWIEGFKGGKTSLRWNQIKSAPHPSKAEREITVSTDRRLDFTTQRKNPDFVPLDKRVPGQQLSPSETRPTTAVYKYPKALRDKLQIRVEEIIALIQHLTKGEVTSFFFSAERNYVNYRETIKFDGTPIEESDTTDDETIIQACRDFASEVAMAVETKGKELSVAEPPVASEFESPLEADESDEPIEP